MTEFSLDLRTRVQAILILVEKAMSQLNPKDPVRLPHKLKVKAWIKEMPPYGSALLTRNMRPIFGHEVGKLLLTTLVMRPQRIRNEEGLEQVEFEYEWSEARSVGGISPDKLYSEYDHSTLPGLKGEQA